MTTTISSRLPADIAGRVIRPDDPEYDATRQILSGAYDRHPAVIVRAANADDVARVIRFARETGTELAVRAGLDARQVTSALGLLTLAGLSRQEPEGWRKARLGST